MGAVLTERRQLLLKLVIQEFIERAVPVASETLVRKYDLAVSPATVRNDLAILEELGYLTHLHTSAGRLPTDAGYRFFVENLMDSAPLNVEEQRTIRHQFAQVGGDFDQWVQLAASILARTARSVSVVTPPRAYQARFKHLELVSIHDTLALLVLVLHDTTVMQHMIPLDKIYRQESLRQVSAVLSERCANLPVTSIKELLERAQQQASEKEYCETPVDELERQVLYLVVRSMLQVEEQMNEQIYSDGLVEMLSQPEFLPALMKEEDPDRGLERMRQTLELLSSNKMLGSLILHALATDGVQVIIGAEHTREEMQRYSVILSRYGVEDSIAGVLGVVGPTRMLYPRSISTVQYLSLVMSEFLGGLYGGEVRSIGISQDTSQAVEEEGKKK